MLFKGLALTALAGAVLAQEAPQTPDLVTLLSNQTDLSNLTSYLQLFPDFTGQLGGLQNITLLAPNNAAFANLLNSSAGAALTNGDQDLITALFSYHVINGTYSNLSDVDIVHTILQPPQFANVTGGQAIGVYVDGEVTTFVSGLLSQANVAADPLNFTGGVVHIIDNVLLIPQNISETAIQLNLSAIAGALTNASLVEAVDYLQDVTVFVPNNDAFAAIGSALPNLTVEQLTSILSYHVVNGTVGYSSLLENGTSLPTLQGNNVTVTIEDSGDVFVNGAKVVIPDVLVANGVVHVIDNVLNPDNSTATPSDGAADGTPAFEGASSASDIPFTSNVPQPTSSIATSEAPQATAASSSSSGLAAPMQTGALGAAALFGGAALVLNM